MKRFISRSSAPTLAAVLCAVVALLSYLALVAYEAHTPLAFWRG